MSRSCRAGSARFPGRRGASSSRGDDLLPAEPLIPGAHNRENAAAATAAARAAGIPDEAIAEALRTFPGVEHRIEDVGTIAGVRYVNDSKATNVAAALRALASFPGARKLVILGGRGKAEPYAPLAEAFAAGDRAYLIGEATEEIAAALEAAGVAFERSGDLPDGGRRGRRAALRRRCRAALAGLRELRPVHELRAARGGVREAGAEAPGVKSRPAGQLEQRLLVLVTLGLVAFGLVMVFSATSASAALGAGDPMTFLVKQGAYALVGPASCSPSPRGSTTTGSACSPRCCSLGALALCIAVLVAAPPINGARRWFLLGPISVQPSELAKIAVLHLGLRAARAPPDAANDGGADEAARPRRRPLLHPRSCSSPTSARRSRSASWSAGILVVSEVPLRLLALAGSIALVLGAAAIYVEPYRRARFLSFLDPWQDPQGAGFQTVQAIIGMGSGGITGEGLGRGSRRSSTSPRRTPT